MSTRCQIKYKNSEDNIYIYQHCDGYPSNILPFLIEFTTAFFKARGDDECYFLAQYVRHRAVYDYKEAIKYHEKHPKIEKHPDEDDSPYKYLSHGLDCQQHGDIDYLYEVDSDGSIYVNGKKVTVDNLKKFLAA